MAEHVNEAYCACWFCTLADVEDDYEDLDCEDCSRLGWPCEVHHELLAALRG